MDQAELLSQMEQGYRDFKRLLEGLSTTQMLAPGVAGAWSVKDIVAHITEHARRMLRWLEVRLQGRVPEAFQPYAMPEPELAVLNDQIYQQYRDYPLAEVLVDFDQVYAEGLAWVRAAPEADLLEATRLALLDGEPLWEAVAANTYQHYAEHGADIRRWLADVAGRCGWLRPGEIGVK